MKQFLAFVAILLATLSMINADFVPCPPSSLQDFSVPLNVDVFPDHITSNAAETFNISGSLQKQLTSDYKLIITFTDGQGNPLSNPSITEICNVYYGCPIDANFPIKLTKCVKSPDQLASYGVIVAISQITVHHDILGCAIELVGVSRDSYSMDTALNHITSYLGTSSSHIDTESC